MPREVIKVERSVAIELNAKDIDYLIDARKIKLKKFENILKVILVIGRLKEKLSS